MAISKRRKEVLAEYGKRKPIGTKKKKKKPNNDLPVHSPIFALRELERDTQRALHKKEKEKEKEHKQAALRKCDLPKLNRFIGSGTKHVAPHVLGQLSAACAKKGTREAPSAIDGGWMYYNGLDHGIEEQHHFRASPHDISNTNLIEEDPLTGTLTWYGDVCIHCGSPPKDVGEVMLAQYGQTEFICTDCGKHMPHHGTGMRGYMTGQIYFKKNKKLKPIPKWRMPIINTYEEEEEDDE